MSDLNDRYPDDDVDQIAITGLRGRGVRFAAAPARANESRKLKRELRNGGYAALRNRLLPSPAARLFTFIGR
jgi:hypothetical protein